MCVLRSSLQQRCRNGEYTQGRTSKNIWGCSTHWDRLLQGLYLIGHTQYYKGYIIQALAYEAVLSMDLSITAKLPDSELMIAQRSLECYDPVVSISGTQNMLSVGCLVTRRCRARKFLTSDCFRSSEMSILESRYSLFFMTDFDRRYM